jgi:hypothetical protein
MAHPAPGQVNAGQRAAAHGIAEDSMNSEAEKLLPPARNERWLDLCFRLTILALAAFWLLTPPAGGAQNAAEMKAVATTR